MANEQLKYGFLYGTKLIPAAWPMGASEVVSAQSGRFAKLDGSGRLEIAVDGSTELVGGIEEAAQTCSATEGATLLPVNVALDAVYRIPVNSGTYVATMRGKTCDLSVASNIQGAQLDASSEDTVVIVDGDVTNNNFVDVMLNPGKRMQTGVV